MSINSVLYRSIEDYVGVLDSQPSLDHRYFGVARRDKIDEITNKIYNDIGFFLNYPKFKTEDCIYGKCSKGINCRFAHSQMIKEAIGNACRTYRARSMPAPQTITLPGPIYLIQPQFYYFAANSQMQMVAAPPPPPVILMPLFQQQPQYTPPPQMFYDAPPAYTPRNELPPPVIFSAPPSVIPEDSDLKEMAVNALGDPDQADDIAKRLTFLDD